MIYRLILIWIILMATCLSALGDENATNPSITITSISPQIDFTLKGVITDFTINVSYNLKDNDYGKILLSINENKTGSADLVYTISSGDLSKGSHVFKINKLLGKDWKNVYVSATLYTAKKDKPLPSEYSAFDYSLFILEEIPHKSVFLDVCSLPSTQGWTYIATGNNYPEMRVFSAWNASEECLLMQNSIGIGFQNLGCNGYAFPNVVDTAKPFVLYVRARVQQEEQANNSDHWGFCFKVGTGTKSYGIGISPHIIAAFDSEIASKVLSTSIDNTEYHDYRLEGMPGIGYKFYVDNILVGSGLPRNGGENRLFFGDGTGGCNANADVFSFEFAQPDT